MRKWRFSPLRCCISFLCSASPWKQNFTFARWIKRLFARHTHHFGVLHSDSRELSFKFTHVCNHAYFLPKRREGDSSSGRTPWLFVSFVAWAIRARGGCRGFSSRSWRSRSPLVAITSSRDGDQQCGSVCGPIVMEVMGGETAGGGATCFPSC